MSIRTRELVDADQADDAARQMREVNTLSTEALREVRGVVAGYREVNLDTELKGAQVVLRAAGAQTRIIGAAEAIEPEHRTPLAWAVREAVTNVVRHSNAQHCTSDADTTQASVLIVTIDGVPNPAAGQPKLGGTGLAGLADRLRAMGGSVHGERTGDSYQLRVEIPKGDK